MTKNANSGPCLIGVFLILGALVITTGGVLVWGEENCPRKNPARIAIFSGLTEKI